jgi:peptidase M50B-like protein
VGIRVLDIKIHRYGGVTHVDPDITEAKAFLVGLCGYAGPPVLGVVGAILLSTGRVPAVLWLSLVLLACVLWLATDWYSRIATAVLAGLILLVLRIAGPGAQTFFAYTWIWFLLIGGLRNVFELSALRATGKDTFSDAFKLGKMTYLPAAIFVAFFAILGFAALVAGGLIMAGALGPAA